MKTVLLKRSNYTTVLMKSMSCRRHKPSCPLLRRKELHLKVNILFSVITDYFGNPELSAEKILTDEQGRRWFCTGDLVNKLPGGIVRFAGRSKRIIKRGGNLVHAEEVEACLLTHPKIAAAAVTDEPHPVIGQQIVAYIQPRGDEKVTRGELARYFDGKLSAYKVPDKVVLVEEIPKDIGKIQFKYLRKKEYK